MNIGTMMATGLPAETAKAIAGSFATAVTAAGSALADATAISADVNVVTTTPGSTGVRLPTPRAIGDRVVVANLGANALAVYPPTALAKINNGSAGAAETLSATQCGMFIAINATDYVGILGA